MQGEYAGASLKRNKENGSGKSKRRTYIGNTILCHSYLNSMFIRSFSHGVCATVLSVRESQTRISTSPPIPEASNGKQVFNRFDDIFPDTSQDFLIQVNGTSRSQHIHKHFTTGMHTVCELQWRFILDESPEFLYLI